MRLLLVGENNPYGPDPKFALYPSPEGSAGHRLCCLVLDFALHWRAELLRVLPDGGG